MRAGASPLFANRAERRIFLAAAVAVAVSRLPAIARSMFDWDEGLFTLGVLEYDVSTHHPHPPGYPLFIAAAKLVHLFGVDAFRSLQVVVLAGAFLIFPAMFAFARRVGFDHSTSLCAALLFSFLPNVWLYGGTAFSDVPAAALTLAACALLLHGRVDSRALLGGSVLLGIAAGIRPAVLLIGIGPAFVAVWSRWRDGKKVVAAAVLAGVTLLAASYGGAALASSSPREYRSALEQQSRYVRQVDSWRNPGRPPLPEAARMFWLFPIGQRAQMTGLALLALVSLAAALRSRSRLPWLVLAVFTPAAVVAWLNLDVATTARYAIAYMPLHALLAADGIRILSAGRKTLQFTLTGMAVAVFTVWAWPAVRLQATELSPPWAALDWAARHVPLSEPLQVHDGIQPLAEVRLAGRPFSFFGDAQAPSQLGGGSWIVDLSPRAESTSFTWSRRNPIWKIVRRRNFEIWVARASGLIRFGNGWYGPEGDPSSPFRWMSAESESILPAAKGRLAIRGYAPLTLLARPPEIEVRLNGVLLERFSAAETPFSREWRVDGGQVENVLTIRTSATANPAALGRSGDSRELGLCIEALTWTAAR